MSKGKAGPEFKSYLELSLDPIDDMILPYSWVFPKYTST